MRTNESWRFGVGLFVWDLFASWGGGQRAYQVVIESCPQILFFYPVESESPSIGRPRNAIPVPWSRNDPIGYLNWLMPRIQVLDLPEWHSLNVHAVLSAHNPPPRLVIAHHGRLSTTLSFEPEASSENLEKLRYAEHFLSLSADQTYGLSDAYLDSLVGCVRNSPVRLPDATLLRILSPRGNRWRREEYDEAGEGGRVRLLVPIGRNEFGKGYSRIIAALPWLDPEVIGEVRVFISDANRIQRGTLPLASALGIEFRVEDPVEWPRFLHAPLKTDMAVFPALRETFGIAAGEAAMLGYPTIVSLGVMGYEQLIKLTRTSALWRCDFSSGRGSAQLINQVATSLMGLGSAPDTASQPTIKHATLAVKSPARMYMDVARCSELQATFSESLSSVLPAFARPRWLLLRGKAASRNGILSVKRLVQTAFMNLLKSRANLRTRVVRQSASASWMGSVLALKRGRELRSLLRDAPSEQPANIKKALANLLNAPVPGRLHIYRYLARDALARGSEAEELAYLLRLWRLDPSTEDDVFVKDRITVLFSRIGDCRSSHWFSEIASDPRKNAVVSILENRDIELAREPKYSKPEFHRDWNRELDPTISVIVSMFQAQHELRFFLTSMEQQTVLGKHKVEFIFVDSASPAEEYVLIAEWAKRTGFSVQYLRTSDRETIQAAWNRGVGASKGEFLVLLGVDEFLFPTALETLLSRLLDDASADWVVGDALVYAVESDGEYREFELKFDRRGGSTFLPMLDSTFLTYVGGMYRKSIHRWGWYDDSFSGAGDTEFKLRMLSHVRWVHVPKVLGLFTNFPRGTTTASAIVECEDWRAWYLQRSEAALRWRLRSSSQTDLLQYLRECLSHRKSFQSRESTDVALAASLAEILTDVGGNQEASNVVNDLLQLNEAYLDLDRGSRSIAGDLYLILKATFLSHRFRIRNKGRLGINGKCALRLWNDNRFQQHSWVW